MLRVFIVDTDEVRAEKLSEIYRKNGAASASAVPYKASIKRYLKRHKPDIILMIHPFSGPFCLSYMAQAKQCGSMIVSALPKETQPMRLVDALSDLVFPLDEVISLGESFIQILENKASELKFEGSGRKGYRFKNLFADTERGFIYCGGKQLPLTPIEYQILCLLIIQDGGIVEKRDLKRQIWGISSLGTRTLESHLCNLRKKLRKASKNKYSIYSVRGVGCQLVGGE